MKILIDEDLVWTSTFGLLTDEEFAEEMEALDELCAILKQYTVHHILKKLDNGFTLTIEVQKCTLDEEAMNDLFYNVITNFRYKLEYAALGGKGCDFALHVSQYD